LHQWLSDAAQLLARRLLMNRIGPSSSEFYIANADGTDERKSLRSSGLRDALAIARRRRACSRLRLGLGRRDGKIHSLSEHDPEKWQPSPDMAGPAVSVVAVEMTHSDIAVAATADRSFCKRLPTARSGNSLSGWPGALNQA